MQSATSGIQKPNRIISIDLLRGLVMIIMALDHVRDFFHTSALVYDPLNLNKASVAIFFTRYITHFCAPVFVFLAGTSAFLTLERRGKKDLSKFLFTRGLWLVIAEITIINFGWDFQAIFSFMVLQVIWALGVSMIVLSILIHLPKRILLFVSLAIILGHNLFDNVHFQGKDAEAIGWALMHDSKFFAFKDYQLLVAYPVLPWIGVMAAGYCFGEIYTKYQQVKRQKILTIAGLSCIILFIVIRLGNSYGDLNHWSQQKNNLFTILSFLNTRKYPPSLLYILMTLGPAFLFLAYTEKPLNRITKVVLVYGRVPMFYYILHIYFIHIAYILIGLVSGFKVSDLFNSNILNPLPGPRQSLVYVYIIWLAIVLLLYPLCRSYDKYKTANKQKWWLSYL